MFLIDVDREIFPRRPQEAIFEHILENAILYRFFCIFGDARIMMFYGRSENVIYGCRNVAKFLLILIQ